MKKDLKKILAKEPLVILSLAPSAYILIIILLLCAEGTNINDWLSQFNQGNSSSIYIPGLLMLISDKKRYWANCLLFSALKLL